MPGIVGFVMPKEKQARIARETLEIYAPIANRLGINHMKVALEDLGFRYLHPYRYAVLENALKRRKGSQRQIVKRISERILQAMEEEDIEGEVVGREKHLYSIYKKMAEKKRLLSDVADVYGFRVIVGDVNTCYRMLGLVHGLYKPMPGRFKDYIAIPRINGYQSLHTAVIGRHRPIEVQIRTEDMEAMANHGIAAHWLYKSESDQASGTQRARQWVQNLLELQRSAGSPIEFVEHVKVDLFPDEIYVFTPKGKILELPTGATPVDFAYAVHTDVGNHCVACRIDKQPAPLSTHLQNGQTIEVITSPAAQPSPAWRNFVVTGKARSNIRNYLKNQRRSESVALGERLLSKALNAYDRTMSEIDQANIDQVLSETELSSMEDLLKEIGAGNRMAPLIARRLLAANRDSDLDLDAIGSTPLAIDGTEGLVVNFAKCCSPIPGDPIIGHISSGRGLVVHTESCRNIGDLRDNPEKVVHLSWDKNITSEFTVDLYVYMENRRGIIVDVAAAINMADANIDKIDVEERDAQLSVTHVKVSVQGRKHLARVIRRLRTIRGVSRILRTNKHLKEPS